MCATCSSATIPPRSWWTGQLMAKVPTASPCTSEARQAISFAAARTGSGGTLSTIIKGRQCDSPPDICPPRQLSATEPLFSAPWGEARLGRLNLERTKRFEPGRIRGERLAPDMLSFGEQFSVSCNKVEAHMAKLMQHDPPATRNTPMMYPALKRRLVETRGFLQNVQPDEIASAQSHTYALTPPIVRGWFGGEDYIRHLVLPDFFFHISIAHAILRHLGAKIGKRDYLGNLTQQSGGDYS